MQLQNSKNETATSGLRIFWGLPIPTNPPLEAETLEVSTNCCWFNPAIIQPL